MMTARNYIVAMMTVCMSIFAIPGWEWIEKGYLFSVVAVVTAVINLVFKFNAIRRAIVQHLTADIITEIMIDADVRKLIDLSRALDAHTIIALLEKKKAGKRK